MDGMIFLPHSDSKLIHNAAVHTNIIVFYLLAQFDHVNAIKFKVKQSLQQNSRHYFDGSGRRKTGTIRYITIIKNIKTDRKSTRLNSIHVSISYADLCFK